MLVVQLHHLVEGSVNHLLDFISRFPSLEHVLQITPLLRLLTSTDEGQARAQHFEFSLTVDSERVDLVGELLPLK